MHDYDCDLFNKSSFGLNRELHRSNMTHIMFHTCPSCRRSLSHVLVFVGGLGKLSDSPCWVEGTSQISAGNTLSLFLSALVQREAKR